VGNMTATTCLLVNVMTIVQFFTAIVSVNFDLCN
jgi:hypothetical protein